MSWWSISVILKNSTNLQKFGTRCGCNYFRCARSSKLTSDLNSQWLIWWGYMSWWSISVILINSTNLQKIWYSLRLYLFSPRSELKVNFRFELPMVDLVGIHVLVVNIRHINKFHESSKNLVLAAVVTIFAALGAQS